MLCIKEVYPTGASVLVRTRQLWALSEFLFRSEIRGIFSNITIVGLFLYIVECHLFKTPYQEYLVIVSGVIPKCTIRITSNLFGKSKIATIYYNVQSIFFFSAIYMWRKWYSFLNKYLFLIFLSVLVQNFGHWNRVSFTITS